MHGDLRLWLDAARGRSAEWVPRYFELASACRSTARTTRRSVPAPVVIDGRFALRGSIDLVEQHGALGSLRVTDHKTGATARPRGLVVGGGETLQPVLYASRSSSCSAAGVERAAVVTAPRPAGSPSIRSRSRDEHRRGRDSRCWRSSIARSSTASLPQAPRKGACTWCDFRGCAGRSRRSAPGARDPAWACSRTSRRCGGCHEPASPTRSSASASARRSTRRFVVEAAAGTGKTTELVGPHRQRARAGRDDGRQARRGDLHREGRGRAEAAPARGAGARAAAAPTPERPRRGRARRGARAPRGGARQHHPRLLRRPAARAPGRGVRRSALRGAHRAAGARRCSAARSTTGSQARLEAPPRRRAPRPAAAHATTTTGRSAGCERAGVDAGRLARLHARRGAERRLRPGRPRRRADRPRCMAFAALTAGCADTPDDGSTQDTELARRLGRRASSVASRCGRATTTGSRRSSSRSTRVASSWSRGTAAAHGTVRQGRRRAQQVLDAHAALEVALEDVPRRRRRRPRGAACTRSCRPSSPPTRSQGAGRRARLPRPAAARARPGARPTRRARGVPAALHAPLRRRVPGHRSAAGRDPAAARGRRSRARRDWRAVRPVPGKLFVVGDPKQSIYRFRRADVGIYEAVLRAARGAAGAARVRAAHAASAACPAIQRAVNAAFAPRMTGDRDRCRRATCRWRRVRDAPTGQPAVVALPVPQPYERRGTARPSRRSRVASPTPSARSSTGWCSESGWTVTDRERPAERAPIAGAARLPAVPALRTQFGRPTSRGRTCEALEARGMPHLLVGGKSVPRARGGRDAAHRARRDRVARRRAVGVRDAARPAVRVRRRRAARLSRRAARHFHPFAAAAAGARRARAAARSRRGALTLLRDLHAPAQPAARRRHDRALLEATRAHAGFALRPARRAGARQRRCTSPSWRGSTKRPAALSFRGFVERLRERPTRDARRGGADPRGGHRRRAPDDRAQGQGPRVPGRGARRHRRRPVAEHRIAVGRYRARLLRGERSPAGRRRSCASTRRSRWRATRPKASASPTSRRRAPATCWSCARRATAVSEGWVEPLNAALYPPEDRRREASRERWAVRVRPRHDARPRRHDPVHQRAAGHPRRRRRRAVQRDVVGSGAAGPRSTAVVRAAPRGADRQGRRAGRRGRRTGGVPRLEGRARGGRRAREPAVAPRRDRPRPRQTSRRQSSRGVTPDDDRSGRHPRPRDSSAGGDHGRRRPVRRAGACRARARAAGCRTCGRRRDRGTAGDRSRRRRGGDAGGGGLVAAALGHAAFTPFARRRRPAVPSGARCRSPC